MLGKRRELNRRSALGKIRVDDAVVARLLVFGVVAVQARMLVVYRHNHQRAEHFLHLMRRDAANHHRQAAVVGECAFLQQRELFTFNQELRIGEAPASTLERRIAHVSEQITMHAFLEIAHFAFRKRNAHSSTFTQASNKAGHH